MAEEKVFQHCRLLLALFSLLALSNSGDCVKRKIEMKNYTCPFEVCKRDSITIIHVTAVDKDHQSSVDFLWSTFDTPSIVVAYASKSSFNKKPQDLIIDWRKLISNDSKGAIKWEKKLDFINGFEIAEINELHDPDDDVIFKPSDFARVIKHSIRDTVWDPPFQDGNAITFYGHFLGGRISFMLNASSEDGRGVELPRQLYSNNGTRFSIILDHLNFNQSDVRVCLKLLTHSHNYENKQKSTIMEDRSIDDEYSPGIFRTFVIRNTLNRTLSSFVSWKPVAYNGIKRKLKGQIPSYQYYYEGKDEYKEYDKTDYLNQESSKDGVSKVIQAAMDVYNTYPLMVSYGQKKDGWYQKKNYLIWSGQVGYGEAQFDSMSKTLYVTIFIGLGLPVVFILVGSLYVCFKKYRERKTTSTYGKIN